MNTRTLSFLVVFVSVCAGSRSSFARPDSDFANGSLRHALYQQSRSAMLVPNATGEFRTLQATSMRELIAWTAPVSRSAPVRYAGDFSRYWQASNARSQRLGNTLEAVLAWRANQQQIRRGLPSRFLVTAVEGHRAHVADLIEIAADGSELARYQAKLRLSLRSAAKHLTDLRYQGMSLLTTRESYTRIVVELSEREASAARRGIALAPRWQQVRSALDNGQLPSTIAGRPLPSIKGLEAVARKSAKDQFVAKTRMTIEAASGGSRTIGIARFGGRVFVVSDLAMTGYLQYQDVRRYRDGEMAGDLLVAKTGMRGIQSALAIYTVASPEPISKVTSGIVVVVLVTTDIGIEVVQQRQERAARKILDLIDRDERFHAARSSLLKEFLNTDYAA